MSTFEMPEKYRNMYIHRKNKDLIEAETALDSKSGKVLSTIFRNNNGITGEILTDGIFSTDQMPESTGNVLRDTVTLAKYLSKNVYKGVTKIMQTKNGIKFG
jgi:hypothetical protein